MERESFIMIFTGAVLVIVSLVGFALKGRQFLEDYFLFFGVGFMLLVVLLWVIEASKREEV